MGAAGGVHLHRPAVARLQWLHPRLRVSVWDPSPDLPARCGQARPDGPVDADGGRGLLPLDVFADRWGGCSIGEGPWEPGGKTVWFELILVGRRRAVPASRHTAFIRLRIVV